VARLQEAGVLISMAAVGNPYENTKAESFFRTLKMEEIYIKDYRNFEEAQKNIAEFIEDRGGLQPQEIALQPWVSAAGRIRGATCPEGRKLTMSTVRKMGFTSLGPAAPLTDRNSSLAKTWSILAKEMIKAAHGGTASSY
jgi:transposase InsO family protein